MLHAKQTTPPVWCSQLMFQALSARAGKQAEVLNIVIMEMLEGHPVRDVKLKEVLGHTPLQVPCGYTWVLHWQLSHLALATVEDVVC